MEIALSQCGSTCDRQLAIIDKNRDLYITPIKHIGPAEKLVKLGKKINKGSLLISQLSTDQ